MIFLVQFGINKHLQIFQRPQIALDPTGSCNFVSLWKIYSLFQIALKIMWLQIPPPPPKKILFMGLCKWWIARLCLWWRVVTEALWDFRKLFNKERKKEECRKHEWQARVFYISFVFSNSSRVLPTSRVVYQPINHRNLWSIA